MRCAGVTAGDDAGIFKTLKAEHTAITTLSEELRHSEGAQRVLLYHRLRVELLAYLGAEHAQLYTALRRYARCRGLTFECIHVQREIYGLIHKLDQLTMDSPEWRQAFEALAEKVDGYIRFSQEVLFPAGGELLDLEEARELTAGFIENKKHELARLRADAAA